MQTKIEFAQLSFDEKGVPYSASFDDTYFCREDGFNESHYIFLGGNNLRDRLANLSKESGTFTIGETGFGTGLNFFCAWSLLRELEPMNTKMHFVSVEKYPLNTEQLRKVLNLWPSLNPFVEPFLKFYKDLHVGINNFSFDDGKMQLTLIVDDILHAFTTLIEKDDIKVDAWFLDGFAPQKNPQMWADEVYPLVGRLSQRDATFATFTVAGRVRRALQAQGFTVQKIKGFGRKREMMKGVRVV